MRAQCPYCKNSWEVASIGITNCPRCGNAVVVKPPEKPSPFGVLKILPQNVKYALLGILSIILIILILNMAGVIRLF